MKQLLLAIDATCALTDLRPSPIVNQTLSTLVNTIIHSNDDFIHAIPPDIQAKVRSYCAQAESELELYWSRRISKSKQPAQELQNFPYWDNYAQLAPHELKLVKLSLPAKASVRRCLVIGSGPLPMTAIHLQRELGHEPIIDQVDNDNKALRAGRLLWQKTGHANGDFMYGNGESVSLPPRTYDLILVAALAGDTVAEKQAIITNILPSLRKEGRIIVRSAVGIRGLLYQPFEPQALRGVHHLTSYHPDDETINSVYVYKKELQ